MILHYILGLLFYLEGVLLIIFQRCHLSRIGDFQGLKSIDTFSCLNLSAHYLLHEFGVSSKGFLVNIVVIVVYSNKKSTNELHTPLIFFQIL